MFGARTEQEDKNIESMLFAALKSMRDAFDFTSTGAVKQLVVLNIFIEISSSGQLALRNYQKPTDKGTLLSTDCCHPIHLKQAIAYGVGLRMRRLCSGEADFIQALKDKAWALLGRGHEVESVLWGFAKAFLKKRATTALPIEFA